MAIVDSRCSGSPLERLRQAVQFADELDALREALLDHFVGQARTVGHSWTEIGEQLGISRQGAHQRFVEASPAGPLRHFRDRGRAVLEHAQEEARGLGHNYIGTEHILLGLVREREGAAGKALASLNVALEPTRRRIEEIIGRGAQAPPDGPMRMTPRAKKVLELARRSAAELGNDNVDTEHLLVGLLWEGEGVAAQVVAEGGADKARLMDELGKLLGQPIPTLRHRRLRGRVIGSRAR